MIIVVVVVVVVVVFFSNSISRRNIVTAGEHIFLRVFRLRNLLDEVRQPKEIQSQVERLISK